MLETDFHTEDGVVRVVDCMPPRGEAPDVVRLVQGIAGRVEVEMELALRFDYGHVVPWVRRHGDYLLAVAGPAAARLDTPVETRGEDYTTRASFAVSAGDEVPFVLTWYPSHEREPAPVPAAAAVADTDAWWRDWIGSCVSQDPLVRRSMLTLKALTYAPTGGIVAAVTTSLPEKLGGVRNWDYRFCWVRDATLTLNALLSGGFVEEAGAWRDWLLRAVAGDPRDMQIMYGCAGERRLTELELDWLGGYEGSKPVRIGNAASEQFQLDVYGELMDALLHAREHGLRSRRARLEAAGGRARLPGGRLGPARRGHLGGPRAAPALRALQGDGVGGVRPRGADGRTTSAASATATAGARAARRSTATCASTAGTPSAARSPSPTARGRSTPRCC